VDESESGRWGYRMHTSDGQRSYTVGEDTLFEAADLLEALANFNYLAHADAHDPEAVKRWTNEAATAVKKLGSLIQNIVSG
jgi:hypothetical protein